MDVCIKEHCSSRSICILSTTTLFLLNGSFFRHLLFFPLKHFSKLTTAYLHILCPFAHL